MGELVFFVVAGVGILVAIAGGKSSSKRQQARRQVAMARWHHAAQTCATNGQFRLAHVTRISQRYPRRGTKAWLTWHPSNVQQDAWFEHEFPPAGSWVVVSGSDGYGPHTHNPHIFYVERVYDVIML